MTEKGNRVVPKDYQEGKKLDYLHIKNSYVNASLEENVNLKLVFYYSSYASCLITSTNCVLELVESFRVPAVIQRKNALPQWRGNSILSHGRTKSFLFRVR